MFVGFLATLSSTFGLYDDEPDITQLTPDNIEEEVLESGEDWLIQFYYPNSPLTLEFVPEFEKVADILRV